MQEQLELSVVGKVESWGSHQTSQVRSSRLLPKRGDNNQPIKTWSYQAPSNRKRELGYMGMYHRFLLRVHLGVSILVT